jgi:hypothetical protein
MATRTILSLVLTAAALAAVPVDAGGLRQAQLRISLSIVDSCDIALVPAEPADEGTRTAPATAQVQCSDGMPHQLQLARPDQAPVTAPADDASAPQTSGLEKTPQGPATTTDDGLQVSIATVTF